MITQPGQVLDVNTLINLNPAGPRQPMPEASDQQRLDPAHEIELGYELAEAKEEAKRCLNCGLLCYYRTSYH